MIRRNLRSRNSNKKLYETIMKDVAKTVKKYLNEANTNININNINYDDFKDIIPDNDIIKEHRKFLVKFNNIRKKLLLNDYFLDDFLTQYVFSCINLKLPKECIRFYNNYDRYENKKLYKFFTYLKNNNLMDETCNITYKLLDNPFYGPRTKITNNYFKNICIKYDLNNKFTFETKICNIYNEILKNLKDFINYLNSTLVINSQSKIEETKEFAFKWILNGKPCRYRYGYGYRGAGSKSIDEFKAIDLLPKYSFGQGFYELSFVQDIVVTDSGSNYVATEPYGKICLMFNQYSANDFY